MEHNLKKRKPRELQNRVNQKRLKLKFCILQHMNIYSPWGRRKTWPDCVVIFDTERKIFVILEATRLQIPIVGPVDPSMPLETFKKIAYPVPANDSVQFMYLFCNLITKTIQYEQKKLAAAKGNVVKEVEPKIGEATLPAGTIKIDGVNDEPTVLPYEGLSPAFDDPT